MPDADADLELAIEAAREAGRIALGYFRKSPRWHEKADRSPVSEADLAVDAALKDMLLSACPDDGWLSEETADDPARLKKSRLWVLDPLDGTRGFLLNDPHWCVSLALVVDHRPVIGVIHAPALGRTWSAAQGKGAFLDGGRIQVSGRAGLAGAHVIGPRYIHDARLWGRPWPDVSVTRLPSLALRLARVASADADAMIAPGYKSDWDIAAGDIIIREAGGVVTDARGEKIIYNRESTRPFGVIAANARLHGALLQLMKTCKGHGGRRAAHKGKRT